MSTYDEGGQFEIDIETTPEWEIENQKLITAQAELGSELLALGLPNAAVMASMNGDGFTCYLDVAREEREAIYTQFAQAFDIEIDEDENFYSGVNEALAHRLDNLFGWNQFPMPRLNKFSPSAAF